MQFPDVKVAPGSVQSGKKVSRMGTSTPFLKWDEWNRLKIGRRVHGAGAGEFPPPAHFGRVTG